MATPAIGTCSQFADAKYINKESTTKLQFKGETTLKLWNSFLKHWIGSLELDNSIKHMELQPITEYGAKAHHQKKEP